MRDSVILLIALLCVWQVLQYRRFQKANKTIIRMQKSLKSLERLHHIQRLLKKDQEQMDILTYTLLDHWDLFRQAASSPEAQPALKLLEETLRQVRAHRAPRRIPPRLLSEYTMNGAVPVREKYRDSGYPAEVTLVYEKSDIDAHIKQIRRGEKNYPRYGRTNEWLFQALKKYGIRDKNVVVMGSNKPWFESVCLFYGGRCTTIEYNRIRSDHQELKFMTPQEYDKNPVRFDAALSISSFEHDGLGRYGDLLNPNGDLEAMKKMKSILLPGGILFLSVPVGRDLLIWNAHRVYGKSRLPLLLKGWKTLETYGFEETALDRDKNGYEPLFVLENTSS